MKKDRKFALALVTGASSGIGEALCRLLARQGISLLITGRNRDKLELLRKELGEFVKVESFVADLSKLEGRSCIIEQIYQHVPDLIINNAGFGLYGEALTHETKSQLEILDVDAAAVLELSIESARALVSSDKTGVILNVSSAAAFQVFPCFAVYAAAKACINSFSESFDQELKPYGIRVLVSCPGMVKTRFRERAASGDLFPENSDNLSMSEDFAAQQIWNQIQNEKDVHIFDWKYRFLICLSKALPKRWVVNLLRRTVEARHKPRQIIRKFN